MGGCQPHCLRATSCLSIQKDQNTIMQMWSPKVETWKRPYFASNVLSGTRERNPLTPRMMHHLLPKKKVGRLPKTQNSRGVVVDFWAIVSSTKYLHCFKHIPLIFSFSFITDCPCSPKPAPTTASVGNSGANGNSTVNNDTTHRHVNWQQRYHRQPHCRQASHNWMWSCTADSQTWFDEH